jgi:lysozyme family protein
MARETLSVALKLMFGSNGGYSNSKSDSGGPTKYGITHRTLAAHRGVGSVPAMACPLALPEQREFERHPTNG